MKRLRNAWRALCGEEFKPPAIYAYDSRPRLTQLTYFQDMLVGLSNEGDLYSLKFDYSGGFPTITILSRNPLD